MAEFFGRRWVRFGVISVICAIHLILMIIFRNTIMADVNDNGLCTSFCTFACPCTVMLYLFHAALADKDSVVVKVLRFLAIAFVVVGYIVFIILTSINLVLYDYLYFHQMNGGQAYVHGFCIGTLSALGILAGFFHKESKYGGYDLSPLFLLAMVLVLIGLPQLCGLLGLATNACQSYFLAITVVSTFVFLPPVSPIVSVFIHGLNSND